MAVQVGSQLGIDFCTVKLSGTNFDLPLANCEPLGLSPIKHTSENWATNSVL